MNGKTRYFRLLWLVPVLMLVGTAIGARFILNGHPSDDEPEGAELEPNVFSIGYTDVVAMVGPGRFRGQPTSIEGMSVLLPGQSGRVQWVIKEGAEVEKGDLLLKLDNRQQKAQLDQASADLDAARQMESHASTLEKGHKHAINQQERAVQLARLTKDMADEKLKEAKRGVSLKLIGENEFRLAEINVDKAKQGILFEQEKLEGAKALKPETKLAEAKANVQAKEGKLKEAQLALEECEVRAPTDGTVMRVQVAVHELLGNGGQIKAPPIQFCPKGKTIVRAEILQEWASRIKIGQDVVIEDNARSGLQWKGKVYYTAKFMTKKRDIVMEPFMVNDVRTMECKIEVLPSEQPLLIGQQVRVIIKTGK